MEQKISNGVADDIHLRVTSCVILDIMLIGAEKIKCQDVENPLSIYTVYAALYTGNMILITVVIVQPEIFQISSLQCSETLLLDRQFCSVWLRAFEAAGAFSAFLSATCVEIAEKFHPPLFIRTWGNIYTHLHLIQIFHSGCWEEKKTKIYE